MKKIEKGKFYKQGNWYHKVTEVTPESVFSVAFCHLPELNILSMKHCLLVYGKQAEEISEQAFRRALSELQKDFNQKIIQF